MLDSDKNLMRYAEIPQLWKYGNLYVVRDDLLPGGTKRRALDIWLPELGRGDFAYAGPCEGFAQVALAYACRDLGKRYQAWLFTAERSIIHPRTQVALDLGALHIPISPGYLSVVQAQAKRISAHEGFKLLPFGLDHPRFIALLTAVARGVPYKPKEVWCVAGSGTLTRSLQQAWPRAKHFAVQVGHIPDVGEAELLTAPEAFARDAADPPPFPSCGNYDAKAWQFIVKYASPGALFWNVAADELDNDANPTPSLLQEREVPNNGHSGKRDIQKEHSSRRGAPGRGEAKTQDSVLDTRQREARAQNSRRGVRGGDIRFH